MRLFAALFLPDDIRDRLDGVQGGLPEAKRVEWENFHITLAFFGEVDEIRAEDLDRALSSIAAPSFDLQFDGVDLFGGDKPRLAYAAVVPSPALTALHERVVRAARGVDVDVEDRRYVPHATLCRFRRGYFDERLRRWLAGNRAFLTRPFRVEGFTLYESRLGQTGPAYFPLRGYQLAP